MITKKILNFIAGILAWVFDKLPSFTLPVWLQPGGDLEQKAGELGQYLAGFDQWLPLHEALDLALIGATFAAAVLVLKGAQFVVSLFTGGGGAT